MFDITKLFDLKKQNCSGAKTVLMNFPDKSIGIPIESDEVILDCDTDDDYFLINTKMS